MTEENLRSEIEKDPFVPLRIHLVSGKTLDVKRPRDAWLLSTSMLILRNPHPQGGGDGYDSVSYRNIERLEQLEIGREPKTNKKRR